MSILSRVRGGARRIVGGRSTPSAPFFFDEVRPDDTYLVSFPRSGNTYLRHLVASLLLDRRPTPQEVQELVPDFHRAGSGARPKRDGPLVAKSHAPVHDVPAKVVYLVRDGRSALLSYHQYLERRGRPVPPDRDAVLTWREVWPCPWPEHVTGWLNYLDGRDRALVVRYEDLVSEPARVLGDVAALAGLPADESALHRAVGRSSVESMRAAEREGPPGSLNFVGSASSDWRDAFSAEALCRFEHSCGRLLDRLGYQVGSGRD